MDHTEPKPFGKIEVLSDSEVGKICPGHIIAVGRPHKLIFDIKVANEQTICPDPKLKTIK